MKNLIKISLALLSIVGLNCSKDSRSPEVPTITYEGIDPEFERALIDLKIDLDGLINNSLILSRPDTISELTFNSYNIASFKGIDNFTNLAEISIYNYSNTFESLDLNKNPKIELLDISATNSTIKPMINFANCNRLRRLQINSNCSLSEITFSNFPDLEDLSLEGILPLSLLDLQKNPRLAYLSLGGFSLDSISLPASSINGLYMKQVENLRNINLSSSLSGTIIQLNNLPNLNHCDFTKVNHMTACITKNCLDLKEIIFNLNTKIDSVSIYPHSDPATPIFSKDKWTSWLMK